MHDISKVEHLKEISNMAEQKTPAGHYRLQIDLSAQAYQRLLAIRAKTDPQSNAQLIRNALRFYAWYLDQKRRGVKLRVVEGGVTTEVELLP